MLYGHLFAIHLIGGASWHTTINQMRRDLVAKKIEIDPALCRSTYATAQQTFIKSAGCSQVCHWKSKMKRRHHVGWYLILCEDMLP